MRFKNYFYIIIIFLTLTFIFIPNIRAAIVIRYEEIPVFIIMNLVGAVLINVIVEFGVVYVFLRSHFSVKKELFLSVVLVNLVIFPPTYTIAYFILIFFLELLGFYIIVIEIIMMLIEWLLYRLEFQKLVNKKSIQMTLSLKKTILISTLANFASFSVLYLNIVIALILYSPFFQ